MEAIIMIPIMAEALSLNSSINIGEVGMFIMNVAGITLRAKK
jgi:hypothetical protein